ncbi:MULTISPECIES: HU family DNA-binding protein [Marinifilum]|uniref:HU domain-containing protein n=1 Tax=Marinifilum TaxID=866673 RepID=UPI002275C674|nr:MULTISPECIES: HU family DNA-binding protein [Marinifilum]MCY1634442.1 HU family DNA-binding protein [Marinifilum sp. D737]
MHEISKYIQDLLFVHDCVILPGFGGFVANYRSARIDENQQMVFPPSKDLGFNRNLTQNDGLLINHLADLENLSYAEAEKAVMFFVEDIRVKIQRGEKVVIDGIGSFCKDRKHNLQFEPVANLNYLVDSLGLEEFELTKLHKPVEERIPSIVDHQVKGFFTTKRIWYVSAAAAVLLAVALLPLNSERNSVLDSASMGFTGDKNSLTENHVQLKPQISPPEELVKFEPKIEKNKVPAKISKTSKGKFYLIAGSFTTVENAKILQEELISKSYPAMIIKNKNLFSVAINQFNTRKAVDQFKKKAIAANPKSSYWVLKQ